MKMADSKSLKHEKCTCFWAAANFIKKNYSLNCNFLLCAIHHVAHWFKIIYYIMRHSPPFLEIKYNYIKQDMASDYVLSMV